MTWCARQVMGRSLYTLHSLLTRKLQGTPMKRCMLSICSAAIDADCPADMSSLRPDTAASFIASPRLIGTGMWQQCEHPCLQGVLGATMAFASSVICVSRQYLRCGESDERITTELF